MDLTIEQRVRLLESQIFEAIQLMEYGTPHDQGGVPGLLRAALKQVDALGTLALSRGCCLAVHREEDRAWEERETDTSWGDPLDSPYLKSVAECWDEVEE